MHRLNPSAELGSFFFQPLDFHLQSADLLEELLVALADTLWKGVRRERLERMVLDEIARRLEVDVWSIYVELDSCFDAIAEAGPDRLMRSSA